jgi:hypothetical protein
VVNTLMNSAQNGKIERNDRCCGESGTLVADYIVVEIAKNLLGPDWLPEYVLRANTGGIERVLV